MLNVLGTSLSEYRTPESCCPDLLAPRYTVMLVNGVQQLLTRVDDNFRDRPGSRHTDSIYKLKRRTDDGYSWMCGVYTALRNTKNTSPNSIRNPTSCAVFEGQAIRTLQAEINE